MHQMTNRAHARKLAIRSMLTLAAAVTILASGAAAGEAKARKPWRNAQAAVTTGGTSAGSGLSGIGSPPRARYNS